MSGLFLAGNLMIDRYASGVRQNYFIGPLNAAEINLNPGEAETKKRVSKMRDTYNQTLDSVVLPGQPTISMTIDDASPEILAFAMLGSVEDISQSSGTGVTETVSVAAMNYWHKIGAHNVSSVVVENEAETVTYDVGLDYEIDADTGAIMPIGSNIQSGDNLHLTYDKAATSGKRIVAAQDNDVTAYVMLDGVNLATQKACRMRAPKAVLTPSGDLSLGGEDFVSFQLSGDLVTPAGYTAPYTYEEDD